MGMAVISPVTGETLKEFDLHSPEEVERRIQLASDAHKQLKKMTYAERAKLMHVAADLMEADIETTAPMLTREMGKPIAQSRGEVLKCAKNMRFYADNAEKHH